MIKTADLTLRQKKIAITLCTILLIYLLFGFIGAPFIVRSLLEKQVAEAINRQVTVGPVRINPITLSATVRDLNIRETGGAPFLKLDEAYLNLQASSLFKWALVLKSVRVVNPDIALVRTAETIFNFSDIGRGNAPEAESTTDGGGFALAVYDTRVTGGRIAMDDRVVSVTHHIADLNLNVSDLSSRPADVNVTTLFKLSARINGAVFSLDGRTRPFAPERETKALIGLKSFQVTHYLPYVQLPANLVIRSLQVETETEINFRMTENNLPDLLVAGLFSLQEVQLVDGNGEPFVNHRNLSFDLLPSAVLTGQIRLAQVDLSDPEIFLKRLPTGDLYLPFLAVRAYETGQEAAAKDTTGQFEPVVTIDRLNLKAGVVHFTDMANSDPFSTTITDLNLEVDNFGLNSDRTATYRLDLKTEADESISLSGTASLARLQVSGEIDVSDIQVSRYVPYYKDIFEFKTVEGNVSFGGNYRFRKEDGAPLLSLANVHLDVDALKVVDEDDDEPLVSLDRLRLADTTADLARREVTIGSLMLSKANISCRREKDGSLNLVKAFVPAAEAEDPITDDAAVTDGNEPSPNSPTAEAVVVNLKAVKIGDVSLDVEDRVPEEPVRFKLDEIALSASNLSTAPDATGKADLSLRWEQGGQVQAGGNVTIAPLALDMAIVVKKMDVRPFQPYLSEQAGLIVTQGFFNTEGRMKFSRNNETAPKVTYTGKAGLNRFASIDRKNANDFLKWEALLVDKLEVGVNPTRLFIDQVSLADFFARVIVDPDGSVNLVTMFNKPGTGTDDAAGDASDTAPPKEKVAAQAPSGTNPPVRIARITLSGGDVDFSDRFIKPNFNAKFNDLGGRVSGLESIAEKRAEVLLEGMWSNHAPVKITGQINPLIDSPYVNLNLNISDIELSPFSPYSGKYIGYILEKGKLTFNVAYLMENRKLEATNSIFINQLTLGDSVESPDAVSLPIKLAVALLKDREGNIALDLPVSGSLDDPEFKIGRVVLTVLKNLIVKIVSSPFAALGALAGGGEELSYLEFGAGISEINEENGQKMDKLARILFERPGLNLDIQGAATPESDGEALRAMLLENQLKGEKLRQMMKSGKSAVPLEEIVLSNAEKPALLNSVFAASGIAVPVDDSGKPVELTAESMGTLLRTHTEVTKNDYRKLSNARAFNAKNYLLENGQVARERLFIVEPSAGTKTKVQTLEGTGSGQVIFSLK
ncbi:DUF748 domain-containing protein [Desulfosarcina sp.]|uniref:DUF748 domain-containing protein n=1 Tax=Desulfosarcina sp. TaxID=2027861 RepID=UPI0029AA77E5|nr:DUF748 domain-containing protein [Desulfosarcina sp.]MDX2451148.1 DUF748 domain-containing protein [Desulfosarcina sp.]MDX2488987.1 DUF748 domain-containing protein [Desulfosarcina sp.]